MISQSSSVLTSITYRYDLICLERGHGGYGGNVGDMWDTVDPSTNQLKADACFASGWYVITACISHDNCHKQYFFIGMTS